MFSKLTILLLFALSVCHLSAQVSGLRFQQVNTLNGLSISSVYKIIQDKNDFIWLATNEGLVKYDGYSYKFFKYEITNPNSLPENWVLDIVEDKQGNLWLGTQGGGLCRFNPNTETFKNFQHLKGATHNVIKSNIVRSLYIDDHQHLWLGTQAGLSIIDLSTESTLPLPESLAHEQGTNKGSINAILNSMGSIYFGCWGDGLIAYHLKTKQTECYKAKPNQTNALQENKIKAIKVDAYGKLWIATRGGGVNILDPRTKSFTIINSHTDTTLSPNSDAIQSILIDSRGNTWMGTFDGGLNMLDAESKKITNYRKNIFNPHSLPGNWVASIFEDRSGLIWIGTDRGLAKVPVWEAPFIDFKISTGASGEFNTNAILQDKRGDYWFGTWGGGLVHINKQKKSTKIFLRNEKTANSISNNNVWDLREDKNGKIWVGTGDGLDCLDPATGLFTKFKHDPNNTNSLIHNNVSALLIDSKNRIWIGSWGEGLSILDSSRSKFIRYKTNESASNAISDDFINQIFEDSKHRVWIATAKGGLNLFNENGTFSAVKCKPAKIKTPISCNIESICEDKDGHLWIGSNGGGLMRLTPETHELKLYTHSNGLSSDIVHRLLIGNDGKLWISTNNGISSLDLKTEQFKCFYEEDGLQSNEFNRGYFKCSDGMLLFGGNNGVSMFDPLKIKLNHRKPKVAITDFKISNTQYPIERLMKNGVLELSYKDAIISFEFSALDFHAPSKNKYSYQLEGQDTSWIDAGNRRFTIYTNLSPGDYVFRVRACNNNGEWNNEGIAIKIKIKPPFWQTWWFYLLVAILGFFALLHYNQRKVRRLRVQHKILQKMVSEKTAELLNQKNIVEERGLEILAQKREIEMQKQEVEEQRDFVTQQRDMIIEQNQELTDSIQYAKKIQSAMLNKEEDFAGISTDYFILFKPREIVSGDFYLFMQKGYLSYIAVADCTGHGIPGAFMSVLGISSMIEIINQRAETNAARVLEKMRTKIIRSLHQTGQIYEAKDGMDISFCIIDHHSNKLSFSGANHPLYLIRKNELIITKGDPIPIGIYFKDLPFTNYTIDLEVNDSLYMFTDGYIDQFGGGSGRKFMQKTFKELLLSVSHLPMEHQKKALDHAYYEWKGEYSQIDDILILGFKYQPIL